MCQKCRTALVAAAVLIASSIEISNAAAADPKPLFRRVNMETMDLTEKQAKILARLKSLPTSREVTVVTLRRDALESADAPINIAVGPRLKLEIRDFRLTKDDSGRRLEWLAKDKSSNVVLRATNRAVSGIIM